MKRITGAPLWRHRGVAALVFTAGCCGIGSAQADALLEQAQALQQQGAQAQAFALLDAQELQRAGDPVFDKALAAQAEALGLYTRALLAWERALQAQPDDAQAQDGVARMLQVLGDLQALQALPSQVRERSTAVGAALDLDQALYAYDRPGQGGRSSWHGALDVGVGHDSNLNAGLDPQGSYPQLPGVPPWSVDPMAWARSSGYVSAALTVRGRYVLGPQWSLVGGGYLQGRHYGANNAGDDPQLADGHAGLAWRYGRNEWFVTARGIHEGLGGRQVRGTGGLQGEWVYRVDGLSQFGAFVQALQMHYPGQGLRDVRRTVAGMNQAMVLPSGSSVYWGVHAGQEAPRRAGAEDLGHRLYGARLGGQWALQPRWALYGSVDAERRRYGASDPFFHLQRRDTQWRVVLGVSWIPAPGWRISPQVEWVDVQSTVPIYPYQRRLVSITVRREF